MDFLPETGEISCNLPTPKRSLPISSPFLLATFWSFKVAPIGGWSGQLRHGFPSLGTLGTFWFFFAYRSWAGWHITTCRDRRLNPLEGEVEAPWEPEVGPFFSARGKDVDPESPNQRVEKKIGTQGFQKKGVSWRLTVFCDSQFFGDSKFLWWFTCV